MADYNRPYPRMWERKKLSVLASRQNLERSILFDEEEDFILLMFQEIIKNKENKEERGDT